MMLRPSTCDANMYSCFLSTSILHLWSHKKHIGRALLHMPVIHIVVTSVKLSKIPLFIALQAIITHLMPYYNLEQQAEMPLQKTLLMKWKKKTDKIPATRTQSNGKCVYTLMVYKMYRWGRLVVMKLDCEHAALGNVTTGQIATAEKHFVCMYTLQQCERKNIHLCSNIR